VQLNDRYTAERGTVYLTGIQALVRLPLDQMRRDRRAGLKTASYISGYEGSPLGGYDMALRRVDSLLKGTGFLDVQKFPEARFTSADFFAMFGTPFVSGGGWSAADDESRARVAVISQALARQLFGASDAVGKTARIGGADFRIVGVMAPWRAVPHFYDLKAKTYVRAIQGFLVRTPRHTVLIDACVGNEKPRPSSRGTPSGPKDTGAT